MKKSGIFFLIGTLLILILSSACNQTQESGVNVLVVAGGHNYDTSEFVDMFHSVEGIRFDTLMQPHANQMIASKDADAYDVIVFYDMWGDADSLTREGYQRLLERGTGMVFLHHSLAGYPQWHEMVNIIGGKYHSPKSNVDSSMYSTYKHDLDLQVNVVRDDHPLTKGMSDFNIHDEGYGNIELKEDVMVLLTTDHPDASSQMGWVNTYKNSKIVYLMFGHDKNAYENEHFRKLLGNAIHFVIHQDHGN